MRKSNHSSYAALLDRLRTVIAYDRICVLDAGQVAVSATQNLVDVTLIFESQEFDTPMKLYANPDGIFRGMCDRSSIDEDDIKLASKLRAVEELPD
jgi:ABC-type multidrug transport system fused ATPase/permease subunit